MVANVGGMDRVLRAIAGVVLVLVALGTSSVPVLAGLANWAWLIGLIGAVMLATAVFRFCPAYLPFGLSTCPRK